MRGFRARRFRRFVRLAQLDIRLRVSHITLILPGAWGLGLRRRPRLAKGETSDTWHNGAGGGIWLAAQRPHSLLHRISHSTEADLIYFKGGFAF